VSDEPLQPPDDDPQNPKANGATIHVDGVWPFLVWLFGPIRQGGTGMIIALMIIVFGAYELDKLGAPLLEKYGEYIQGQTEFTNTVKKGMESQAKAIEIQTESIEATKTLVAQNGERIDTTSADAIQAAADAKVAASNANESAKQAAIATADVAKRLLEAGELMAGVSKRRDEENAERLQHIGEQTKVLGELLGVQNQVLETLQACPKNDLAPSSTQGDGA
jgi:hypothetical protein